MRAAGAMCSGRRPGGRSLLCGLLLLAGCAPFVPQRVGVGAGDICPLPQAVETASAACREASVERAPGFDIAYIEMTDQGWFHLRAQWERAWQLVDAARGGQGDARDVQVVLFIHGWRHTAAFDDVDVRNFREVVMPTFAAAHPERRTVGLYIGWRGRSLEMWGVERLSFYDRKATAERVARGSIREVIGRLRHQARSPERRVHLSLIGHSFGGLIVYSAIAESLLDSLFAASANGGVPKPVVDLALAINPAFEASRFEPLFQVAQRLPRAADDGTPRPPIFVSITSEADAATKAVFPVGRALNSMLGRESWTDEDDCPSGRTRQGECPSGDGSRMLERLANTNTIGHLERYQTHRLDNDGATGAIRCTRLSGAALPLWTVRSGAAVMSGHHDIYRPELWRWVVDLANGRAGAGC